MHQRKHRAPFHEHGARVLDRQVGNTSKAILRDLASGSQSACVLETVSATTQLNPVSSSQPQDHKRHVSIFAVAKAAPQLNALQHREQLHNALLSCFPQFRHASAYTTAGSTPSQTGTCPDAHTYRPANTVVAGSNFQHNHHNRLPAACQSQLAGHRHTCMHAAGEQSGHAATC